MYIVAGCFCTVCAGTDRNTGANHKSTCLRCSKHNAVYTAFRYGSGIAEVVTAAATHYAGIAEVGVFDLKHKLHKCVIAKAGACILVAPCTPKS